VALDIWFNNKNLLSLDYYFQVKGDIGLRRNGTMIQITGLVIGLINTAERIAEKQEEKID